MDCFPGPSSRPVEMKDGSRIGDSGVDGGEAEAGAAKRRRTSLATEGGERRCTSSAYAMSMPRWPNRDWTRQRTGWSPMANSWAPRGQPCLVGREERNHKSEEGVSYQGEGHGHQGGGGF